MSTRDTFRDLVVDNRFPGYAFEYAGFAGREFVAIQAFATHYDLDAEITPLFSPELSNPLFLHLACKTLKDEGHVSLDIPLSGFAALLENHLKHCDNLVRKRLLYSNPRNLVRVAMLRLTEVLTQNPLQDRTWEACTFALETLVGREVSPEALLNELGHEGLVILSAGEGDDEWLVRLGYQRYGDVLRATSIIESVKHQSGVNIPALAAKLGNLSSDEGGVLEAIAAVLPEKAGIEVTLSELGLDPELAHRLFINALAWRSRNSITHNVDNHIHRALSMPDLWQQVYEVFFRLSLVPGHRLNAANWLGPFQRRLSMTNRDAFFSVAAFKSFDANGAVWSLINAGLHADIKRWPIESRRLATFMLSWLTSCADRRVRDLSAKALARVIATQPDLGRELVVEFEECDDDYILEGITLAIYSACLLERSQKKKFVPTLEALLMSPVFDTPNVLVRDSVRLLGGVIQDADLPEDLKRRLDVYPSSVPAPNTWPKLIDAKKLLDLEKLPLNMELWGSNLGPDFWRYQVETKIREFNLQGAGINHENIACWIMVETLRLGYPGYKKCALHTDLEISYEFGPGRSHKGYAERLGKKYYWLLLHRLIGILSDNVTPQDPYSDRVPGPEHLWSVNLRKADLTDVRDINSTLEYPDDLLEGSSYVFPDTYGNIKPWIRTDDFTRHEQCIVRISTADDEWVALSLFADDDDRPAYDSWREPYLRVLLSYKSIFIDESVPDFGSGCPCKDAFNSSGTGCYQAYLAEYPDGLVFHQLSEQESFYKGPEGMEFSEVRLSRGNEWEYDYSYTTVERQESLCVPCRDLVKILTLQWDKQRGWTDSTGALVAFEVNEKHRNGLFILRSSLNKYLKITGRKLVYRRFANRLFFGQNQTGGSQIDLFTWLLYRPNGKPIVLKQDSRPFNCGNGPMSSYGDRIFPFR